MVPAYARAVLQIRQRTRDAEYSVISTRRQPHTLGCFRQQSAARLVRCRDPLQQIAVRFRIGPWRIARSVIGFLQPFRLSFPRGGEMDPGSETGGYARVLLL